MSDMNRLPNFTHGVPEGEYGFSANTSVDRLKLPGQNWESGNMFTPGMVLPNCNMEDAEFDDRGCWRFGNPDTLRFHRGKYGAMFSEIFYSASKRRLQAVEQLTLPPEYSTVPNTAAFSNFEHGCGCMLFIRQMCEQEGIAEDDQVLYEARGFLHDDGKGFGGHFWDWLQQSVGGPENQHDLDLPRYLEVNGVSDILRKYGIEPSKVIATGQNNWVESKSPDLCVDRVDYGLREMNRWNDVIRSQAFSSKDFTITPDNMLAMTDQRRARIFAEGYLLLSQENWSEPTHRFMENMLLTRAKLFYGQGGSPRAWVFNESFGGPDGALVPLHEISPLDLMYVTDPARALATSYPNIGIQTLDAIMKSVAQYHRQYFWPGESERIRNYMHQFVLGYEDVLASGHRSLDDPSFSGYKNEYPTSLPLGFAILEENAEAAKCTPGGCIDIPLKPFKARQIDPLVKVGAGYQRLSILDPSYKTRLAEHAAILGRSYVARMAIPDTATREIIQAIMPGADAAWNERMASSRRMTEAELRELVRVSSDEIFGPYPFMTFYTY